MKQTINNLKDYAELAQAAYGYYDLIGKKIENDKKKYGDKANEPITLHDILDLTYKDYITTEHTILINVEKLDGDFSSTQIKNFFNKYDLLIHQPNTESGFSATLFEDTKDNNTKILAIRGIEFPSEIKNDVLDADVDLMNSEVPSSQYVDIRNL